MYSGIKAPSSMIRSTARKAVRSM